MRSHFIVRPVKSAALTALTLLFTFAIMTASAKAFPVDDVTRKADQAVRGELVQVAKASRHEARAARRGLRKEMRDECRANFDNRQDRRNCMREGMRDRRAGGTIDSGDAIDSASRDASVDAEDRAAD